MGLPRFFKPMAFNFVVCLSIGVWSWATFNNMPDAASAMQSFHALAEHGLSGMNSLESISPFGVHLWPLGLIAMPFFLVAPSYLALVMVQSLILSLSVPAASRIAHSLGCNADGARRWTWFWALSPLVLGPHGAWGESWQPLTLAITPLLWAIAFALEKRWKPAIGMFFLGLLAREDFALIGFGYGLWVWWGCRRPRLGMALMVVAMAWLATALLVAIPHITGESWRIWSFVLPIQGNGGGAPQLWSRLIPGLFLNAVQPLTVMYLGYLALTLGMPNVRMLPALAACLPVVVVNLSIGTAVSRIPFLPYSATLAPFLFLAALHSRISEAGPSRIQWAGWGMAMLGFLGWQVRLSSNGLDLETIRTLECLEGNLPRGASLSLSNPRGGSRFSWGQEMSWMNEPTPMERTLKAEVVIVDHSRKGGGVGWFPADSLVGRESVLASSGARLGFSHHGVNVWSRIPLDLSSCK